MSMENLLPYTSLLKVHQSTNIAWAKSNEVSYQNDPWVWVGKIMLIKSKLGHWFGKNGTSKTQLHHSPQTHPSIGGLRSCGKGSRNARRIWKGVNKDKPRGSSIYISHLYSPAAQKGSLLLELFNKTLIFMTFREKNVGPDHAT